MSCAIKLPSDSLERMLLLSTGAVKDDDETGGKLPMPTPARAAFCSADCIMRRRSIMRCCSSIACGSIAKPLPRSAASRLSGVLPAAAPSNAAEAGKNGCGTKLDCEPGTNGAADLSRPCGSRCRNPGIPREGAASPLE